MDNNVIRQDHFSSHLSFRVVPHHDLNFDAEHTLAHEHVAHSFVNVVPLRLTGRDEVPIFEFHCLRSLCTQLATDDDLDTLAVVLHHEAENAVACAPNSESTQEFVSQRLCLCHCASSPVFDPFREEFHAVLRKVVTLLNHSGKLTDAASLISEHLPGLRCADDDLCADGCDANLHTCVAILGQRSHQELVQFGVEDTVCDKLSLLRDLSLIRHIAGPDSSVESCGGCWLEATEVFYREPE
mmetsp:Transcript_21231/g.35283  ORF Transcript_21231/g.35283 Transcript_21231/m.35283 type:complete len:241 (-) Transcript_21231:13-735(-)